MALSDLWKVFLIKLILSRSFDKERARREFILNILLVGSILLTTAAFVVTIIDPIIYPSSYSGASFLMMGSILVFFCFLLVMSRLGRSRFSTTILVLLLLILATYTSYRWGADVSAALLLYGLVIVMAGILASTKFAFIITTLSSVSIILLSYLEVTLLHKPDYTWKSQTIHMGDAVVYVIMLGIIAIVSWLSNREIEKSLKRAHASEAALKRQRDKLEVTVEKRTKELKFAQAEKLAQLYRFAQFGRMASGLFHDLVNPLNLVSLNLDRLSRKSKSIEQQKLSDTKVLLERAVDGTRRLESFVEAARRQVQHQEAPQTFSLANEITQVAQMLEHKAKKSHVKISLKLSEDIKIFGNSIKFSQLVTNLVLNAIDAYENVKRKEKLIEVALHKINSAVRLEVRDWGSGINKKYLPRIFDPLFTTKPSEKGMGMGLSISKDIVEKDLKGKCIVKSKIGVGTTFIVEFPIRKNLRRVG